MEQYAFCKNKTGNRGNMEMRTMFGRHMALVITKVNVFYINLYNNYNIRTAGRNSMGWDEFVDLTKMTILEQLQLQFEMNSHVNNQLNFQNNNSNKLCQQLMPPQPPPPPYTAQPIQMFNSSNKRAAPQHGVGAPPAKKTKVDGGENFDPMELLKTNVFQLS